MIHSHFNGLRPDGKKKKGDRISGSVSPDGRCRLISRGSNTTLSFRDTNVSSNTFSKVELSISSYDTAWMAMIPSLCNPNLPHFPQCLNWLLENQLCDGSWRNNCSQHLQLFKDSLMSTLACILALKRWKIGEEHVIKGIEFIKSNFSFATSDVHHSPIGFGIIFPSMLEYCFDLGLNLPLNSSIVDAMLYKRDSEFRRVSECGSKGSGSYLAFVAEGLTKLQNWEEVMKHQRKNGSLFNSPSTTAAALSHVHNDKCLEYLHSLIRKYGNAVPTVYPFDVSTHLFMVDKIQQLGLSHHFKNEIECILSELYRRWIQNDEDVYLDARTHSLAFRLLRSNGYNILPDTLYGYTKDLSLASVRGGYSKEVGEVLELYKASNMEFPDEIPLGELNSVAGAYLKRLSNVIVPNEEICKEIIRQIDLAFKFPFYADLERLENRRNIENYEMNHFQILKTTCVWSYKMGDTDLLKLATQDFNTCQDMHREELKYLERWMKEYSLHQLEFARQKTEFCYFSGAATFFSPELSEARLSWAKNGVLTTVVDDFFDVGGSIEELEDLVALVEKWDVNSAKKCCSRQVETIFYALYNTVNELGAKASKRQRRNVTPHIIETWLCLLKSMMKEAYCVQHRIMPTFEEYMDTAHISFALGPILIPSIYFVEPELSDEAIKCTEFNNLFKSMSTCGRLLNDIQGFKKEKSQGKYNSVSLLMFHENLDEGESIKKIKGMIEDCRKFLVKMVYSTEGSVVPMASKDLFWKMTKLVHVFYKATDGFSSETHMSGAMNDVLYQPVLVASDVKVD